MFRIKLKKEKGTRKKSLLSKEHIVWFAGVEINIEKKEYSERGEREKERG